MIVPVPAHQARSPQLDAALEAALEVIAAGAAERDAEPRPEFPEAAIAELERVGALAWNATAGRARPHAPTAPWAGSSTGT
jgi:hypothetical protein